MVGGAVSAMPAFSEDGHEAETETETEERAGGAGYPTSQFTGVATAASVGGPVSGGTAETLHHPNPARGGAV